MAKRKRIVPDTGKSRCINCFRFEDGLCKRLSIRGPFYSYFNVVDVGEKILSPQTHFCSAWAAFLPPGTVDDLVGYDGEAA